MKKNSGKLSVHSFICLFVCLFVHLFVYPFVRSFVRLFNSFIHSFIRSFIQVFTVGKAAGHLYHLWQRERDASYSSWEDLGPLSSSSPFTSTPAIVMDDIGWWVAYGVRGPNILAYANLPTEMTTFFLNISNSRISQGFIKPSGSLSCGGICKHRIFFSDPKFYFVYLFSVEKKINNKIINRKLRCPNFSLVQMPPSLSMFTWCRNHMPARQSDLYLENGCGR